jgi:HPr kinase/phosphorylase
LDGMLTGRAPVQIAGLIEARGIGILRMDSVESVPFALAVDLDRSAEARLPQHEHITILGCKLRLISGQGNPNIDAVLAILLRAESSGRS